MGDLNTDLPVEVISLFKDNRFGRWRNNVILRMSEGYEDVSISLSFRKTNNLNYVFEMETEVADLSMTVPVTYRYDAGFSLILSGTMSEDKFNVHDTYGFVGTPNQLLKGLEPLFRYCRHIMKARFIFMPPMHSIQLHAWDGYIVRICESEFDSILFEMGVY